MLSTFSGNYGLLPIFDRQLAGEKNLVGVTACTSKLGAADVVAA